MARGEKLEGLYPGEAGIPAKLGYKKMEGLYPSFAGMEGTCPKVYLSVFLDRVNYNNQSSTKELDRLSLSERAYKIYSRGI